MQEQHLNGAQILIALAIMGGAIFVACLIYLAIDVWRNRSKKHP